MRAVVQRVTEAKVIVTQNTISQIGHGLLVLLGVDGEDQEEDALYLVNKISQMRIFSDDQLNMNLSIQDVQGDLLVVSQFTLMASTKKGNRPSFIKSAPAEKAEYLYLNFIKELEKVLGKPVPSGQFGAMMNVHLINNGPVTILLDSKNKT